jgi:serine/threonine protein kinase
MVEQAEDQNFDPKVENTDQTNISIDNGKILLYGKLAKGTFGHVYRGKYLDIYDCAVKFVSVRHLYLRERRLMRELLKYPNVKCVKLFDSFWFQTKNHKYGVLVIELMDGNAKDFLKTRVPGNDADIEKWRKFLRTWAKIGRFMFTELYNIHKVGVYQMDVKYANILYRMNGDEDDDDDIELKLSDFGLGCCVACNIQPKRGGTWIPPEWAVMSGNNVTHIRRGMIISMDEVYLAEMYAASISSLDWIKTMNEKFYVKELKELREYLMIGRCKDLKVRREMKFSSIANAFVRLDRKLAKNMI